MNAGFSNLDTLKRQLLAEAVVGATNYDAVIKSIGLGVAMSFEKYCNRKFLRTVNDTVTFPADRDHYYLPRYPVESVLLVEQKDAETDGFQVLPGAVVNSDPTIGMIWFGARLGYWFSQVRVTFTGGFFWETLEPADMGFPSVLPNGATALPDDLKLAWLMQCEITWKARDALGKSLTDNASKTAQTLPDIKLSPEVERILRGYRRFQIT